MADFNKPSLVSTYTSFITEMAATFSSAVKQFGGTTDTNVPVGAIKWNSASNNWQINSTASGSPVWSDLCTSQIYGINITGYAGHIVAGTANQVLYQSAANTTAKIAVNSAATNKFLRQISSGVPSWQTIVVADVTNAASTTSTLAQFAATTSLQLKNLISDETGSGALVFANSPTLVTPALGTPASGTLTNCIASFSGLITSSSPTAGIGYAVGAGGSATTSAGAATLNKICGQISTPSGAHTAGVLHQFGVNNTTVDANDTIIVNVAYSAGGAGGSVSVSSVQANYFVIDYYPFATGTYVSTFNFTVLKSTVS